MVMVVSLLTVGGRSTDGDREGRWVRRCSQCSGRSEKWNIWLWLLSMS